MCADAILNNYDDAPVRSLVRALEDGDVQARLRAEPRWAFTS